MNTHSTIPSHSTSIGIATLTPFLPAITDGHYPVGLPRTEAEISQDIVPTISNLEELWWFFECLFYLFRIKYIGTRWSTNNRGEKNDSNNINHCFVPVDIINGNLDTFVIPLLTTKPWSLNPHRSASSSFSAVRLSAVRRQLQIYLS